MTSVDDDALSAGEDDAVIFANATHVVTCAGPARARRGAEMADAGARQGVAVAVMRGLVAAVAPLGDLRVTYAGAREIDCRGGVLMPGLVDSHTHGVFGRARSDEQELRAAGLDYMEIARRGGGIHASVRDLRATDEEMLFALARDRLARLAAFGTESQCSSRMIVLPSSLFN